MSNNYFQFKQFTVHHHLCAMKVGTDGVLLGAWTHTAQVQHILDVGTGSGLIALMLAQRSSAQVDAIDIDPLACKQAQENSQNSLFSTRIKVIETSLQNYQPHKKYQLMVSNPPYFQHSLKSHDAARNLARHTDALPFSTLFAKAHKLLDTEGRLSLILPTEAYPLCEQLALEYQAKALRVTWVKPREHLAYKRVLLEFIFHSTQEHLCQQNSLVIETDRHVYTPEFSQLTQDFYLDKK